MPTLEQKIRELKTSVVTGARVVEFWEQQLAVHGEENATAFYTHLGLNHIERKSVDFDGLTLRRQPRETEKIAVKGVSQAQESSKEQIGSILLKLRTELISDGLKGIKKLDPATYHTLILETPAAFRQSLRDRLITVYRQGRKLVVEELSRGKADDSEEDTDGFDELDTLVDATDSRVANDVQSRITSAAARFALLGLTGKALIDAIRDELNAGSVGYIDRAAGEAANKVVALGRYAEMRDRADSIGRYEYSALLDSGTCGPCFDDDGKEATNPDDLPEVPNVDCAGGSACRCFIVAIAEGNM